MCDNVVGDAGYCLSDVQEGVGVQEDDRVCQGEEECGVPESGVRDAVEGVREGGLLPEHIVEIDNYKDQESRQERVAKQPS